MPEIKNFPNNQDTERGAEDVMRWLYGRTSGVFGAAGNAAVSAADAGGMAVQVSDGTGWMTAADGFGCVWWNDTKSTTGAALTLVVPASDAVYNRIDRVIVEWTTPNYTDSPVIKLLQGSVAENPSAPKLTNDRTVRQISLARIYVRAGATKITAVDITDERLNASVCGLVTESVRVDTSMMQSQFAALLASVQAELSDLEAGAGVELKKLVFADTRVPVSAFVADNAYGDYGYRASIALDGVIASMIPEVVFAAEDAAGGNFCPVAETYNGGVYIYAASPPETAITVPTIVCWRGA